MTHTTRTHYGNVTVQRIKPLDKRIVRITLSVCIPDYKTVFSETLLGAYEHLALKGTRKKSDDAIDAYIRIHGLMFAVSAGGGYVHFNVSAEREKVMKGIALVRELLGETTFLPAHITAVRSLMREENREAHDDAKLVAETAFNNTLYPPDSFLAMETLEEEKRAIEHITKSKLEALREALRRGEWYISVVGDTKAADALVPFATELSRTACTIRRTFVTTATPVAENRYLTIPGKTNVEIRIGNRLPIMANDDDYVPFVFGLAVLGKVGGFSGRLMSTVREIEGLTYGIYAHTVNVTKRTTGHWNVFTFFTARDLKRGIEATLRELKKLTARGITARELIVFKEILKNQFTIAHESNARRLRFYHRSLLIDESELEITREVKRIAQLTKTEVNAALRKFIRLDALVVSGAGPVDPNGKGILE